MVRALQMKHVQLRETYCLPDEVILLSLCVWGEWVNLGVHVLCGCVYVSWHVYYIYIYI